MSTDILSLEEAELCECRELDGVSFFLSLPAALLAPRNMMLAARLVLTIPEGNISKDQQLVVLVGINLHNTFLI